MVGLPLPHYTVLEELRRCCLATVYLALYLKMNREAARRNWSTLTSRHRKYGGREEEAKGKFGMT